MVSVAVKWYQLVSAGISGVSSVIWYQWCQLVSVTSVGVSWYQWHQLVSAGISGVSVNLLVLLYFFVVFLRIALLGSSTREGWIKSRLV